MNPQQVTLEQALQCVADCELFVCAAGFEERAHYILQHINELPKSLLIGVEYYGGPDENRAGQAKLARLRRLAQKAKVDFIGIKYVFNEFESTTREEFSELGSIPINSIVIDVSAMAQYLLMQLLAEVRRTWPKAKCRLLYVAAESYSPTSVAIREWMNGAIDGRLRSLSGQLTFESSEPISPNQFAGAQQDRRESVMILFAGYEKHRSYAAYDSINPSKLVIIHSRPMVDDFDLRLKFSELIHSDLGGEIERSTEILSNIDIEGHVKLLHEYYEYLFDLCDIVLVPVHSKLQAIACFIFWERFPDVQVMFPIPLEYRHENGGKGVGSIFEVILPPQPQFEIFYSQDEGS